MIRRIAAERLSLPIEQLAARDGAIVARDGRFIGYGELIRRCSARPRIANIGLKGCSNPAMACDGSCRANAASQAISASRTLSRG